MEYNPLLFENQINNNLFKFLVREYFSKSMNPFQTLKALSKILFSKISIFVKLKYITFFFVILKKIVIDNDEEKMKLIYSIINATLDHILTRRADFVIIIKYVIFLVEIGKIDLALSRLQIFSFDGRFMNNADLLFYKGLFEFMNGENCEIYMNNFMKYVSLNKNESNYLEFMLGLFLSKNMNKEMFKILKHEKLKAIYETKFLRKYNFLLAYSDNEPFDCIKRIHLIGDELNNIENFANFSICYKFYDLILNFENNEILDRRIENFIDKIMLIEEKYLLFYLEFLFTYFLYDYFNENCIYLLKEILDSIYRLITNKSTQIFNNNLLQNNFLFLMLDHIKLFTDLLLRKKIIKELRKFNKLDKENRNKITYLINKVIEIVDMTYLISYGEKLTKKNNIVFNYNQSDLLIQQIKNIKI